MSRRRSIPFVHQMEAVECGAACLTMILRACGRHVSLGEIREAVGVSRDGVNAASLARVAREYGLEPQARKLEPHELAGVVNPAILHWQMNHFVVLQRWTPGAVDILDPAVGPRRIEPAEFDVSFTGVCIELSPGAAFERLPARRLTKRRFGALLHGARGALALVVAASVMVSVLGLATPMASKVMADQVLGQGQTHWLALVGLVAVGLAVLHVSLSLVRAKIVARVREHLDRSIGQGLVGHLTVLPISFFAQRYASDLVTRVRSTKVVRDLVAGQAVALVVDTGLLGLYVAIVALQHAWLGAGMALACLGYGAVYLLVRGPQERLARERLVKEMKSDQQLYQTLRGIQTVKSSGREDMSFERYLRHAVDSINVGAKEARSQGVVAAVLLSLRLTATTALLGVGAYLVLRGQLSLGALIGVQVLQLAVLGPLERVTQTLLAMQQLGPLFERMDDVLDAVPEPRGARLCPRLEGDIVFEAVSFRYGPTAPLALDRVSASIRRGEKVAFVGPSGSGKSTVARVLLGLFEPVSGRVLFDGTEAAGLDRASLRRQIGVVLQETALFDGTIRENLSLYHHGAPLADIVSAARAAQIHEDIMRLSHGYDTAISASGGPLSGGQRQRLALARAILHRPPIMILDEATSALDTVTELAIERYLASRRCTRIIIAHRLSAVRDADRIFVMNGGVVVEEGTHAELMSRRGLYAEMVARGEARAEETPAHRVAPRATVDPSAFDAFEAFASLPPEHKAALATFVTRRVFPAGATIVTQGDRSDGVYWLECGRLDVTVAEPGLEPFKVGSLEAGTLFGELGLLDGTPVAATLSAVEPVRTLHMSRAAFESLREGRDPLTLAFLMRLGALASERLRGLGHRLKEHATITVDGAPRDLEAGTNGEVELTLEDLPVAATLGPTELTELRSLGERVRLLCGEVVFSEGDEADRMFLVLKGRVGVFLEPARARISTERAGGVFGELGLFDGRRRAATCIADSNCTLFSVRFDWMVERLSSGHVAAWKLFWHLLQSLTHEVRVATLRLREAVAVAGGELDRAFSAREEARRLEAARARTLEPAAAGVPLVHVEDAAMSGIACLTALLRYYDRPVPFVAVREASTEDDKVLERSLARGARGFGFTARTIRFSPADYPFLETPLLVANRAGSFAVLERYGEGRARVMDPVRGKIEITRREAEQTWTGDALEVRPSDKRRFGSAPLSERVRGILRASRGPVAILAATTLVCQLSTVALPALTGAVVNVVIPTGDLRLLLVLVVAMAAVGLFHAIASIERRWAAHYLRTRLDSGILQQMFRHVLALPIAFFEQNPAGRLFERFDALRSLRQIVSTETLVGLLEVPMLVIPIVYLARLDPSLAAVVAVAALFDVAVFAASAPRLRALATAHRAATSELRDRLLDVVGGIVTIRLSGDEEAARRQWWPAFGREIDAASTSEAFNQDVALLLQGLRGLCLAIVTWWGAAGVVDGRLSLGELVALIAVATTLLVSLDSVISHLAMLVRARDAVAEVARTFAEPPEQRATDVVPPGKLRGAIRLEGLTFEYEPGDAVLSDVSLEIEAGTKVALVGASGSGKSTLGKILLGFYVPRSGKVFFDGRDLETLDLPALRAQIGVVLQESFVFTGSVRDNISINAPGARLRDVTDAARLAAIHDVIDAMPMKYETVVSDGGSTFSGGQRQRLALARALLNKPAILLLDEATSALDNLAQAAIEKNLAELTCTRVVIAHRLSTVMGDADKIVVMDRGRIVEVGRHSELLSRRGHYWALVSAQLAGG